MFSWVGSDGWSARSLVSDGNERAVEGTISVQPQANDVKGFKEYFLGLNVKNNKRNPWFVGTYINLLYLSVQKMQLLIEIFYYLKRSTIYGYHKTNKTFRIQIRSSALCCIEDLLDVEINQFYQQYLM